MLLPWLGFAAVAALTLVTSRAPELEADPGVRDLLRQRATELSLHPVNAYATLARPAPPRVELSQVEIRRQLVNRLLGTRAYTATVHYSADGRASCDRFRLVWSDERGSWTSRVFTRRGCNTWF